MTDMTRDAAFVLAQWAGGVTDSDVPSPVRQIVVACMVDTLGVAIAGSGTEVASLARHVAVPGSCSDQAEVLGSVARYSAAVAAFCNAAAAHALDFDDNCYAGFVHGSAVIIPAALAMAQDIDASGTDLVTAIAVGAECEYAVGAASGIELYQKGWWTTGLLGPVGACVAVGHLLKFDADRMSSCIGLAVAGAGGSKACFGSDAKALMAAQASEAGLRWASLAAAGASGPSEPFSHPGGFSALHCDGAFNDAAFSELGLVWRLQRPGIDVKKYPVCLSSHAAVDVVLEVIAKEGITPHDIEEIVCDVPPVVVANLKHSAPKTPREAQFSMEFAVAASICCGALGLDELRDDVLRSDAVVTLMRRVRMVSGTMWERERRESAPEGACVVISLKDGRQYSGYCANALGTAANPMPVEALRTKFLSCAEPVLGAAAARKLLRSLECLDADLPVRDLLNPAPDMVNEADCK